MNHLGDGLVFAFLGTGIFVVTVCWLFVARMLCRSLFGGDDE